MICKKRQSIVCNTISVQCFSEFTTRSLNTNCTLLASSFSSTAKVTESTTDINLIPGMKADATSGKETLWKDLIYNAFL